MGKPKLLVIGIDGATFNIITPLVKQGKLPTFKKIIDGGCWGELNSTIPPVTCPAWPCFMTGKEPKNHGVFDWFIYNSDYTKKFISSKDIKGKRFWDYLNDIGLECGIMNIPISYPPQLIDGFMVSGGIVDHEDKEFTYPREIKKEIFAAGYKNCIINPHTIRDASFLNNMYKSLDSWKNISIKLLKDKYMDVFVVILNPDPIQHRFWKNKSMEVIYDTYQKIDSIINEILTVAGENANIMLISDHGFGNIPKTNFYLNNWLITNKYLTINTHNFSFNRIYKYIYKIGLGNLKYLVRKRIRKSKNRDIKKIANWSKTYAWSRVSEDTAFIYLNRKNLFENGIIDKDYKLIRDKLVEKMKNIIYPQTNEKVIDKIWLKEELFGEIDRAPDIIVKINAKFKGIDTYEKNIFSDIPENMRSAWHLPKGIFFAYGPNIKNKKIKNANLIDIAPTILNLYNISTNDMDGKILNIISKKIEIKKKKKKKKNNKEIEIEAVYDKEDERKIKERLEALGYM